MADTPQFVAARIRLNALCERLPSFPNERDVFDYHSLVKDIESNSTYDLSTFKIPGDKLDYKVVGSTPRSYSGAGGRRLTYSSNKRCDHDYFARQVLGARQFLNEMSKSAQPVSTDFPDYWSKSDEELETLAKGYGLGYVYREYFTGRGLDREDLVSKLLLRDQAVRSRGQGDVTLNFNGPVSGSTIQAASPHATASVSSTIDVAALADVIFMLKAEKPNLRMSDSVSRQFDLNIQTLEREVRRPTPDRSIVMQCLVDSKNTLLAVGAGVASNAVWAAILHFLAVHS
jgi:hypothetical protein